MISDNQQSAIHQRQTQSRSDRLGSRSARCPYVGLRSDPASAFVDPAREHRCHASRARQSVDLDHQAAFCLDPGFEACPRFVPSPDGAAPSSPPRRFGFLSLPKRIPWRHLFGWVILALTGAVTLYFYPIRMMSATLSAETLQLVVVPSPSPTEPSTVTPTAAAVATAVPSTPAPAAPTATLAPGRLQAFLVPAGNGVGWVFSAERLNHFGDRNLHAGVFDGHLYHGAMQFDLISIPLGSTLEHVTVELMGLNAEGLDLDGGGTWVLQFLSSEADDGWPSATYDQIHNARVVGAIGPELRVRDLAAGVANVFTFSEAQLAQLERRLESRTVSFRLDGPSEGEDNLFGWDTGYGGGFGSRPVLRVVYVPPPTPTPLVITATPTPANVLTAAAVIVGGTRQAEALGTPTPVGPGVVTATPAFLIVTNTPTPGNSATAQWESAVATAEVLLYGTPTGAVVEVYTVTPLPTATATPVLVGVGDEALSGYLGVTPTGTPVHFPEVLVGKIAFHSDRFGGDRVLVMDPDGSEVALLTNSWAYEASLAAEAESLEGRYLVQAGWRRNQSDVFLVDLIEGRVVQITEMEVGTSRHPVWSPDNERIAFVSSREGDEEGDDEIFVVSRGGGRVRQLTANQLAMDGHPSWSPDGSQIAYASAGADGHQQIWVMNADGTGHQNISENSYNDWGPVWVKPASSAARTSPSLTSQPMPSSTSPSSAS